MARIVLTDNIWNQLQSTIKAHECHSWKNDRQVMKSILLKLRTGAPWHDISIELCPWKLLTIALIGCQKRGYGNNFLIYEQVLIKNGYSQKEATSAVISFQAAPDEESFERPESHEVEPALTLISPSTRTETRVILKSLGVITSTTANGIQVSGSVNKRFNLPRNFYATVGGNASLKGYWDETDYNDYLLTASTGVGYDDAKNDVSLTPFVTKRYYDEEPYSLRKGVTVSGSRWVKPKLKLSATTIFSNETFEDDSNANRETDGRFLGLNTFYIKDAKEYFYGGLGNYRNDVPKSSIISYDRNSINAGWGREWKRGISTLTTLGYGIKKYDDPADALANGALQGYYNAVGGEPGSTREDKTTSLGLQVWKRDFTLLGLTPRLVFDYETTSSNFAYYDDRDEKSATILLTKTF